MSGPVISCPAQLQATVEEKKTGRNYVVCMDVVDLVKCVTGRAARLLVYFSSVVAMLKVVVLEDAHIMAFAVTHALGNGVSRVTIAQVASAVCLTGVLIATIWAALINGIAHRNRSCKTSCFADSCILDNDCVSSEYCKNN